MAKSSSSKSTPRKETKPVRSASESGSTNQSEMKTSEIRDLIDFISKSGLNEVNIETKELKLSVKREPDQKVFKSTPVASVAQSVPAQPAVAQAAAVQPKAAEPVASGKKTVEI
jgi:acetyl-CoA carboxylase biotin carboxyl carrier protein